MGVVREFIGPRVGGIDRDFRGAAGRWTVVGREEVPAGWRLATTADVCAIAAEGLCCCGGVTLLVRGTVRGAACVVVICLAFAGG